MFHHSNPQDGRRPRRPGACLATSLALATVAMLVGCDTLDSLGTQEDPALLQAGDDESIRILAPADGSAIDTPFTVRLDRLAYASDDEGYDASRARCAVLTVATVDAFAVDPDTGLEVPELEMVVDRGDKTYVEIVAGAAGVLHLRATLYDAPTCASATADTRILATARRDVAIVP